MTPENQIISLSAKLHPSDEEMEELRSQLPLVADWEEAVRSIEIEHCKTEYDVN